MSTLKSLLGESLERPRAQGTASWDQLADSGAAGCLALLKGWVNPARFECWLILLRISFLTAKTHPPISKDSVANTVRRENQ